MLCWRCGVEFTLDVKTYRDDAPCPDCVEDDPGQWLKQRTKPGRISGAEKQRRMDAVAYHYHLGKLDKEIGEAVGLHRSTVAKYRQELGLAPHYDPDKHLWKDREAQIAHIVEIGQSDHKRGKGKNPLNFEGSGPRWKANSTTWY